MITQQDLAAAPSIQSLTSTEGSFPGISIDSRTIRPGELFIAIRGPRFDGHAYVTQALAQGGGAVVSPTWLADQSDVEITGVCYTAPDGLQALQDLARAVRQRRNPVVVAITGTNGKTSTKDMTAAVLRQTHTTGASPGNLNNEYGVPLALCNAPEDAEVLVLEMGASRVGDIRHLCAIARPAYGVLTNIGRAHLESFGNVQQIVIAKTELLFALESAGTGVINGEEPLLRPYYDTPSRLRRFGLQPHNDVYATNVQFDRAGRPTFLLNGLTSTTLRVSGQTSVLNAVAAAAVGLEFGMNLNDIKRGLETFRGMPQRLEFREVNGITVIDDSYNANPESVRAAIDFLAAMRHTPGTALFAILGDMLELGDAEEEAHRQVGAYCGDLHIDHVMTLGARAELIAKEADAHGTPAEHFQDAENLAMVLQSRMKPGDCVLIKGSRGMRMETIVEHLGARPTATA